MKTLTKLFTSALVAGIAGFAPLLASAAPVQCADPYTLGEWTTATTGGGCFVSDKLYKLVTATRGTTLGGNENPFAASFSVSMAEPNFNQHQLVLGRPGGTEGSAILIGSSYAYLEYTVEVYNSPDKFITRIDVDTTGTGTGGERRARKDVYDIDGNLLGTIQAINANGASLTGFSEQFLRIKEYFSRSGNSVLNTAQNTIYQTEIPEPATLALLGLGLAGLGAFRRRR